MSFKPPTRQYYVGEFDRAFHELYKYIKDLEKSEDLTKNSIARDLLSIIGRVRGKVNQTVTSIFAAYDKGLL